MPTLSEIVAVKESVVADLLKRLGVTGVDVGYKYVGGKRTDEISVRVLVREKKDVPADERIPETIQGIKTDVIQRTFVLHTLSIPLEKIEIQADTGRYD